jgi:uncharacterized protein (TIGR00369 family)
VIRPEPPIFPALNLEATRSELIEIAQRVLNLQPFSRLIGAVVRRYERGAVELYIPLRDDFLQQHGFVHGGVISYAADNALAFAGGSVLGHAVVTSEFKLNFVRPARGKALVARASVIHAGSHQAVCRCDVTVEPFEGGRDDSKESLCATSQGTIACLERPSRGTAESGGAESGATR